MKISFENAREITFYIKTASNKQLIRKLKKLKICSEERGVIKRFEKTRRFYIKNSLKISPAYYEVFYNYDLALRNILSFLVENKC